MVQRPEQTVNPAGNPMVQRVEAKRPKFSRTDFMRDLEKVSAKTTEQESDKSAEGKS
jgi:hypothetical protein